MHIKKMTKIMHEIITSIINAYQYTMAFLREESKSQIGTSLALLKKCPPTTFNDTDEWWISGYTQDSETNTDNKNIN